MVVNLESWQITVEAALRERRWVDAELLTRDVVQMYPHIAQAWVFLAEALEQQQHFSAAWHCYERGWILDPQAQWATSAMARLRTVARQSPPDWLVPLLEVPHVRVVGAILARNEAENIERCVQSLLPAVDEVWVIDTGSDDNTVELAEAKGARVIQTQWANDFGRARQAADAVLGDTGWVLWVDADEFLQPDDVMVPRVVAGLYDQMSPPLLLRIVQVNHLGDRIEPNYDTTRMFPLGQDLVWKGRIHEQVTFRGDPKPMQRGVVRIRVDHWGYQREVMQSRGKYERNISLLREWTREEPQSAAAWGFLGRDLYLSGHLEASIDALYQAEIVAGIDRHYGRLPEVRGVLCEALVRLHRLDEAKVVADRAIHDTPDHPTGWYWKGHVALLQASDRAAEAVEAARQAQRLAPHYRGIVSFTPDIPRILAPLTEADALRMQGHWVEAFHRYQLVAQKEPAHLGVQRQLESIRAQAREIASKD